MHSHTEKQIKPPATRKARAFLPIVMVLLCLLSLALVKTGQDQKRGPRDCSHLQVVIAKQNAWLKQHPVLLKVSRISFAGVPGELLTDTCWHFIKAVFGHPHTQTRIRNTPPDSGVPGQIAKVMRKDHENSAIAVLSEKYR